MKLTIITICFLLISTPAFTQEIFGGINFGNSKKLSNDSKQATVIEGEFDVLWKNKKRQLLYNGLSLKYGLNTTDGYKIGLGYKTLFGLNYNETYDQHNIGIESYVGLSYNAAAGYTVIARYGMALDMSLGVRFRLFQNYSAKIMYNMSYGYNISDLSNAESDNFNITNGFSIGFVAPLWVNKKSIFKRKKSLKMQKGETW